MAKIIAAAIVAVSFVLCSAAVAFDLQGHRGARGLAPENTLAAFTMALSIGVTTLELDLAMTSDGILVVSHDSRLNPDQHARSGRQVSRRRGARDPFAHIGAAQALRRRTLEARNRLRRSLSGAAGNGWRAHPGIDGGIRSGTAGKGRPCALQY